MKRPCYECLLIHWSSLELHSIANGSLTGPHTQAPVLGGPRMLSHSCAPTRQAQSPQSKLYSRSSLVCPGGKASAGWPRRGPAGSTSKKATRSYMIHPTASLSSGHHPLHRLSSPTPSFLPMFPALLLKRTQTANSSGSQPLPVRGFCVGISGKLQELTCSGPTQNN